MQPRILAAASGVLLAASFASAQPPSFTRSDIETGLTLTGQVVSGDFNGDGVVDLLASNHSLNENFGIYLLIGNGDGTFEPASRVFAPTFGSALAAADVNGDGRLDILFLSGDFELWVLIGQGDGTFPQLVRSANIGATSVPLLVADFDRDGHPDVAVADQDGGVKVSLGNGDGSFRPAQRFAISGGSVAAALASADFNGDGRADIAAANPGPPPNFDGPSVSLLFGRGDGTFDSAVDVTVAASPRALTVSDFNADGHADLAAVGYAASAVSILLGRGDGTFLSHADYPAAAFSIAAAAADFDGDAHQDLAVCGPPAVLSIFNGSGSGTFAARADLDDASDCSSIAVADFNHDGRPDLALAYFAGSGTISIFSSNADSTPPAITAAATPSVLWPPNGETVSVVVSGTIGDNGSGVELASGQFAATDEYGLVNPTGSFTIAADGTYSVAIPLVASRLGEDRDGRQYTVVITAADRAGNHGCARAIVVVPHDRGR